MAESGDSAGPTNSRSNGNSKTSRWILLGLGYFFVVLGIVGLFLPILQGILFLVIGFILLARASPRARLLRQRLRRRFPEWAAKYDRYECAAKDWMQRQRARLPWRRDGRQNDRET